MIRENQRLLNQLNVVSDGVLVFLAMLAAYWLRFSVFHGAPGLPLRYYLWLGAAAAVLTLIAFAVAGLYASFRTVRFHVEAGRTPLSSGRLGKTFLPGQVGCQAFKDKLGSVACGCIAAEVIGREQRGEKEQQPQNRAKRSAFNHDHFFFSRACPKSEAAGPPRQAPGPATREAPSAEVSDAQVYWSE